VADGKLSFAHVQALTFDCYGTLIDWESGILTALRPLLVRRGTEMSDEEVLTRYGALEAALEQVRYRPYRDILGEIVRGFGLEPASALPNSIGDWPPFADTVEALQRLKHHFRLGIISNIDDDLFAFSQRRLQVEFDWIVTAQQAQAYKPSLAPFHLFLERSGLEIGRVVHVAQSLYHDHVPAGQLGLRSVWVNRRAGRAGSGATPPADVEVQLEVPTLTALADLVI
jgi:2-haloacid dehalogenase